MTKSPPYPVGYKKPPTHSRFQPGQSGNPHGRPKKASVGAELASELNRRVTVRENGKEQKMSKAAALAKSLVSRALGGDMRSVAHLIRLLPTQFRAPQDADDITFDATDAAVLERFVARRLALAKEGTNQEADLDPSSIHTESGNE